MESVDKIHMRPTDSPLFVGDAIDLALLNPRVRSRVLHSRGERGARMQALDYWKAVTTDEAGFLDRLIAILSEAGVRYCVIGGQAVNAFVEPVVSLDLDIAVATEDLAPAEAVLGKHFRVERFPHSVNVSAPGSDLRVQLQRDPRYSAFVGRASRREVLGLVLPVAGIEDVLQGKVWAAQDPTRRPSKRQKDLADISRLLEAHPELRARVPADVLARLF
jgi:hypothetical protein